jgi:hypothetical protein
MKNRFSGYIVQLVALSVLFLAGCQSKKKYEGPTPVDMLVRDMMNEKTFSVQLYDMEVDENKNSYRHKYRIIKNLEDSLQKPTITEWKNVSEVFFAENLDNMGLELASKSADGVVHKIPAPPGYNGYVGNERYGQWRTDNSGNSFWAFYGQYMFMSTMLHMAMGPPIYRDSYSHYNSYRNNPSTRNSPYYGTGKNTYGTNSAVAKSTNPNFFSRKVQQQQLSSFKQKVASNPSRYTRVNSTSSTNSRSSSRSGSSTRSRGGSFGK